MARHVLSGQRSGSWRVNPERGYMRTRGPWVDFPGERGRWDHRMQLERNMYEAGYRLTIIREAQGMHSPRLKDSYAQVALSRGLSTAYDELRNQTKIEGHPRGALRRTPTMSDVIYLLRKLESHAYFGEDVPGRNYETAYHVSVKESAGEPLIEVVCIDHQDSEVEGYYHDEKELPLWMQEKLAVLRLLDISDHNAKQCPGVGARIDVDTFWVYRE